MQIVLPTEDRLNEIAEGLQEPLQENTQLHLGDCNQNHSHECQHEPQNHPRSGRERLQHNPIGKLPTLGQHSSGLDQFRRQVDAINPAVIRMREIPCRSANTASDIENAELVRN